MSSRRTGPLSRLRVLSLGGLGPVPFATMMLADMGADVVRVERVSVAGSPRAQLESRYRLLNRGSRSIAIDLSHPDGSALACDLASTTDLVLEGFRPGVAERLGVGPDQVMSANQRVIYGRVTGWGRTGPVAPRAGHDINYIARNGVLAAIGRSGQPPTVPLNLLADLAGGGVMLVCGLLAALVARSDTGVGEVVDLPMVDGSSLLTTMIYGMMSGGSWLDERGANLLDSGAPYYDVYETADGRWMAVGALEDKFFEVLCEKLDLTVRTDRHDRATWPELREQLSQRFASRTRAEWEAVFASSDACVCAVQTMSEWTSDPQAVALGSVVTVDGIAQPRPPLRFSRSPAPEVGAVSLPGEDTEAVLREWLGRDCSDLRDRGVVAEAVRFAALAEASGRTL
jgi:alpha-methylacyl-CoA racemase